MIMTNLGSVIYEAIRSCFILACSVQVRDYNVSNGYQLKKEVRFKSQDTGKEVIAEKVQFYQWRG